MDEEIQELLRRTEGADPEAANALFTLLYTELHRLAESTLRRAGAPLTIGTTTLLHEAYLNVAGRGGISFADRARFLGYLSRAMRGLVVDYARRRLAQKSGRLLEITLAGDAAGPGAADLTSGEDLVRLGDALGELADLEPALAELVDLHFFCGFTFAEIAALREVSERTVQRDWRKARLLLHRTLTDAED